MVNWTWEIDEEFDKEQNGETVRGIRVTCWTDTCVLFSEESPYDDGLYPWAAYDNYEKGLDMWPISDPEQLIPMQSEVTLRGMQISNHTEFTSHPMLLVDRNANMDTSKSLQPDTVIEKEGNSVVDYLRVPALPAGVYNERMELIQLMEKVSGLPAGGVQGQEQINGEVSGSSILEKRDLALTRLKPSAEAYDEFCEQIGVLILHRIVQFWTDNRMINVIGDNGKVISTQYKADLRKLNYDLVPVVSTSLAVGKQQRDAQNIQRWMQGGFGDPKSPPALETIMEKLDDPDKDIVLDRIKRFAQSTANAHQNAVPQGQPQGAPTGGQ